MIIKPIKKKRVPLLLALAFLSLAATQGGEF
jgi:hypothetical protein